MRPFTPAPKDFFTNGWRFTGAPPPARPSYHIHLLLFVMTVITTVVAGMVIEGVHPLQNISQFIAACRMLGPSWSFSFRMKWDTI